MDKELVELYKGQSVHIFLNNNFHFEGILESVGDTSLIIDDKMDGRTLIKFSDISEIKEWRTNRNTFPPSKEGGF